MNSVIVNVAFVYGTAYITKEIISRSVYYTVYYSAIYVKNKAVEKIFSFFSKSDKKDKIEKTEIEIELSKID